LDRRLGLFAKAEGMPALKEWPEIILAFEPKWLESSERIVFVNLSVVKNVPLSNVKTGKFFCTKDFFAFFKFQRHEKGQKLSFAILKISIKSPHEDLFIFGRPM
jgi:hypothetical protein